MKIQMSYLMTPVQVQYNPLPNQQKPKYLEKKKKKKIILKSPRCCQKHFPEFKIPFTVWYYIHFLLHQQFSHAGNLPSCSSALPLPMPLKLQRKFTCHLLLVSFTTNPWKNLLLSSLRFCKVSILISFLSSYQFLGRYYSVTS